MPLFYIALSILSVLYCVYDFIINKIKINTEREREREREKARRVMITLSRRW